MTYRERSLSAVALSLALSAACGAPAARASGGEPALLLGPSALVCLAQDARYGRLPLGQAFLSRLAKDKPGARVVETFTECLKGRKLMSDEFCTALLSMDPASKPDLNPLFHKYGHEFQRLRELGECDQAAPPDQSKK